MLKTKIKASAVTNLTDARYFAAWEAEWLGFCLDPMSPDYVDPKLVAAIQEWVDGVKIVGEFGMQSAEEIQQQVTELELDAVQLSPFADGDLRSSLSDLDLLQEIVVQADKSFSELETELEAAQAQAEVFLLNFGASGISWNDIKEGRPVSTDNLANLCDQFPVLLGMNWETSQVPEILDSVTPLGIFVRGGEEEKIGYKSYDELDELFELLEVFS